MLEQIKHITDFLGDVPLELVNEAKSGEMLKLIIKSTSTVGELITECIMK